MFQKIKVIFAICLSILIIGVPFLVHCLFKIKASNAFWIAEWSAGEFLSFYGSVLSFGATVILSVLALWQNDVIRKESNRYTAILREMEQNKSCPFIKVRCIAEQSMHSNLTVEIINITDNIALDIKVLEMQGSFKRKNCFEESYEILSPHDSIKILLGNGAMDSKDMLLMEIQCNNIYGNRVFFHVNGEYSHQNKIYEFKVFRSNG